MIQVRGSVFGDSRSPWFDRKSRSFRRLRNRRWFRFGASIWAIAKWKTICCSGSGSNSSTSRGENSRVQGGRTKIGRVDKGCRSCVSIHVQMLISGRENGSIGGSRSCLATWPARSCVHNLNTNSRQQLSYCKSVKEKDIFANDQCNHGLTDGRVRQKIAQVASLVERKKANWQGKQCNGAPGDRTKITEKNSWMKTRKSGVNLRRS